MRTTGQAPTQKSGKDRSELVNRTMAIISFHNTLLPAGVPPHLGTNGWEWHLTFSIVSLQIHVTYCISYKPLHNSYSSLQLAGREGLESQRCNSESKEREKMTDVFHEQCNAVVVTWCLTPPHHIPSTVTFYTSLSPIFSLKEHNANINGNSIILTWLQSVQRTVKIPKRLGRASLSRKWRTKLVNNCIR